MRQFKIQRHGRPDKSHDFHVKLSRITDFMAESRDFIAVTKAEVWELQPGGRQVASAPFLNVSRDHIEIILPGH